MKNEYINKFILDMFIFLIFFLGMFIFYIQKKNIKKINYLIN